MDKALGAKGGYFTSRVYQKRQIDGAPNLRPMSHFTGFLIFQTGGFTIFTFHFACHIVGCGEGYENKGSNNNPTDLAGGGPDRSPGKRLYFGIVQRAFDLHRARLS